MRFYSNESIREGQFYPQAWIWFGKILPMSGNAKHLADCLIIKLPWWARQQVYGRGKDNVRTCQLHFIMFHLIGEPEEYSFDWIPVEDFI